MRSISHTGGVFLIILTLDVAGLLYLTKIIEDFLKDNGKSRGENFCRSHNEQITSVTEN